MKKKITIIFTIFALIITPIYFTFLYFNINVVADSYTYSYKYKDKKIEFYKENKLINTYSCIKDCKLHRINTIYYFKNGTTIINDDGYIFTYDFINGKVIDKKIKHIKKDYEYVYAFKDYLLVTDNSALKIINYKEETLKYICNTNTNNISTILNGNILYITVDYNTYTINLENIDI